VVKIRLKRMGAKKRPMYRIVVADSRSPRDGRFIEAIGFYDPLRDPAVVRIDEDKVRTWMRKGARPSDSARELLVRQGILAPTPRPVRAPKPTAEAPTATAQPVAAPAAETAPAPDAAPVAEDAPVAEEAPVVEDAQAAEEAT
jgi:small subunit ribosomal protein S16